MGKFVISKVEHHEAGEPTQDGIILHFSEHPTALPGHRHFIPHAALADRAVVYGLDTEDPNFLVDVLEHILHERHSGHDTALPTSHALRKSFQENEVDRESLKLAQEHARIDHDLAKAFARVRTGVHQNPDRWHRGMLNE